MNKGLKKSQETLIYQNELKRIKSIKERMDRAIEEPEIDMDQF
jgi:hypothetical protein